MAEVAPVQNVPSKRVQQMFSNDLRGAITVPRVNLKQTSERYTLTIEVPGLTSIKDISVDWTGSRAILIRGRTSRRSSSSGLAQKTRNAGTFTRAYEFKKDVDQESLQADLQNGVLTLAVDRIDGKGKLRAIE